MRYFRAIEIEQKPFIQWDCWATNDEDYKTLGLDRDPLVMAEEDIPAFKYGVCPLKIVDGQLVERTETEMLSYQAEYNQKADTDRYAGTIQDVDKGFFEFNREKFPLHPSARLLYDIAEKEQLTTVFQTIDGKRIAIDSKELTTFSAAARTAIKNIVQPIKPE